jgi:hypothetical protein
MEVYSDGIVGSEKISQRKISVFISFGSNGNQKGAKLH